MIPLAFWRTRRHVARRMGDPLWRLSALAFDLLWPALSRIADSALAVAWLPEPRWFALPLALLSALWLLLPRGVPAKPLALLLWLPLLFPARDLPRHGEAELTVIDVGQGLSVLVRTAEHSLLYDMGPALPDGYDAGAHAVAPALHALGVRSLDAAVISHGDNDHDPAGLRSRAASRWWRSCRQKGVLRPGWCLVARDTRGNGMASASACCIRVPDFPTWATRPAA